MQLHAALLNLVLYTVWVGVPLAVSALVLLGYVRPATDGTMSPLQRFFPVVLIAATITILLDVFVIPSIGFRRLVFSEPWLSDLVRVLLFPIGIFVGRAVAMSITMIKPNEIDARFQSELKGISPLWALIGFAAALASLTARDRNDPGFDGALFARRAEVESSHAGSDLGAVQTALPIYSGVNYDRFIGLIEAVAAKYNLPREIFVALVAEESNFNPEFRGVDGGAGLMNVTASMARQVGIDDYFSPPNNLEVGALVLLSLRERFGADNPRLWIAAYHFGAAKIQEQPELAQQEGEVKSFVDAVMRKAGR